MSKSNGVDSGVADSYDSVQRQQISAGTSGREIALTINAAPETARDDIRRIKNRDSARRTRARRVEQITHLQEQIAHLTKDNNEMAEAKRRILEEKQQALEDVDKLSVQNKDLTFENILLQRQVDQYKLLLSADKATLQKVLPTSSQRAPPSTTQPGIATRESKSAAPSNKETEDLDGVVFKHPAAYLRPDNAIRARVTIGERNEVPQQQQQPQPSTSEVHRSFGRGDVIRPAEATNHQPLRQEHHQCLRQEQSRPHTSDQLNLSRLPTADQLQPIGGWESRQQHIIPPPSNDMLPALRGVVNDSLATYGVWPNFNSVGMLQGMQQGQVPKQPAFERLPFTLQGQNGPGQELIYGQI